MTVNLLNLLTNDEKKCSKLYSSGPYWKHKNKRTVYQIKKKTLENFRGINSGIGTSFADNLVYDVRNEYNIKGRLVSLFYSLPIIKKIFDGQLKITSDHIKRFLQYESISFKNNERVKFLINKYKFKNTTEFGCVRKFKVKEQEVSSHYLEMANRIEFLSEYFDFSKINKYFEIGGGFGSNIHFLIQNFESIKKIIYLDAVPNIYVGTEYLRKFYKDKVIDYSKTRAMNKINFSNNNDLEIYCIPPWEIEKLDVSIDHFHNAASFVEMPTNIVQNYVKFIKKLKISGISLISYLNFNSKTTFDPKQLNQFFDNKLNIYNYPYVISDLGRENIYLIGK